MPRGAWGPDDPLFQFQESAEESARSAVAMAGALDVVSRRSQELAGSFEKNKKATDDGAKSTDGLVKVLQSVVTSGVGLAARGSFVANTTNATFGQGLVNTLDNQFAQFSGVNFRERAAIAQGGQDVQSFFADFVAAGGQVDDQTLAQYQTFFEARRQRQGAFAKRVEGDVVRRQENLGTLATLGGQIQQDIREIGNKLDRALNSLGGGGN